MGSSKVRLHNTMYVGAACCFRLSSVVCLSVTLLPSLAFAYIGSVSVWHSSSGPHKNLWHQTRKGITELLLLVCATYIVYRGRHLAIGPHSTLLCIVYFVIIHAVFSIVIISNVLFQHRKQLITFLKGTPVLQTM